MSRDTAALLVVDIQEKLIPHIQNQASLVWNARRLIDGASVLGVPALCTEQYPKGLGATLPILAERLKVDDENPFSVAATAKTCWSNLKRNTVTKFCCAESKLTFVFNRRL